ncbi:uncharacterized protein LOC128207722 [Mya arenaria]|uniref:uncharacterized protein LOC128207722 n=1 Tax=Mya arenaria TaxID=6604 RepID=UPI0022E06778|nr:uncharacterized protein LOC128207722 [Mya arenaria]
MAGYSSSSYNLTSYEELFFNMTIEEKARTAAFLNHLLNEKLEFKRCQDEVEDIKQSTQECLELFCSTLGKLNPAFKVGRVFPVGSMAEGTRIVEPSEFDFIVALKEWSGNVDVKRITHAGGWIRKRFKHEEALQTFPVVKQEHALIKFPNKEGYKGNSDICAFLDKANGSFWDYKHYEKKIFTNAFEACKEVRIEKSSGIMMFNGSPDFHGPVYSVEIMWKPKNDHSPSLKVDVDIAPAIFVEDVRKVFSEKDVYGLSERNTKKILEVNSFLLMPARKCFESMMHYQFAFTNTEVELIQQLSETHKNCIKLLKFFFRDHTVISSFILKTCVLIHSGNCDSKDSEYECLFDVLKVLVRGLPILDKKVGGRLGFCNLFMDSNLIQQRLYEPVEVNRIRQYMLDIMTTLIEIGKHTSPNSFNVGYARCKSLTRAESKQDEKQPYTTEDSIIDAGMYKLRM